MFTLAHSVPSKGRLLLVSEKSDAPSVESESIFELSSSLSTRQPQHDEIQTPLVANSVTSLSQDDFWTTQTQPKLELEIPGQPALDIQSTIAELTNDASARAVTLNRRIKKVASSRSNGVDSNTSENDAKASFGEQSSTDDSARGTSNILPATFFGTEITGKKFVFVVDSSRSMTGPRWRVATYELLRSLHELMSDAEFFVICFDETDHPVFNQTSAKKFLQNDPKTLERTQKWIESLVLGRGTFPSSALAKAVKMAPDCIFLLSDGVIQDDSILMLRRFNHDHKTGQPIVPIHTILLLSPLGQQPLEIIAAENGGTFKNITIEDILP